MGTALGLVVDTAFVTVPVFGFAASRGGKSERMWWMPRAPEQAPTSKKQNAEAR